MLIEFCAKLSPFVLLEFGDLLLDLLSELIDLLDGVWRRCYQKVSLQPSLLFDQDDYLPRENLRLVDFDADC